jgi:hypothetical protein
MSVVQFLLPPVQAQATLITERSGAGNEDGSSLTYEAASLLSPVDAVLTEGLYVQNNPF